MARYSFLDNKGLATYHQLSGYSEIPVDEYSSGTLNPSTGAVDTSPSVMSTKVVTDFIELPVHRKYSVTIAGGDGIICFYAANNTFISSQSFSKSVSFVLNDVKKPLEAGETNVTYIRATKFRVSDSHVSSVAGDSKQFVIRALHNNTAKWLHDEIINNRDAINDNKTAINNNHNLIVRLHVDHNFKVSPTTIEKGANATITIDNFYFKFDGAAITPNGSVTTTGGNFSNILNTKSSASATISDETTFSYKIVHLGGTFTKSSKVYAYYPMYFGSSTASSLSSVNLNSIFSAATTLNSPTVVSGVGKFTKQTIKSAPAGTYNVVVDQGGFIYLLVPSTMTIKKVKSGGFDVPMNAVQQVTSTNKGAYNVYRSVSQVNGGTISLEIS